MIRVAVVVNHPHVAIALRALLEGTPDIRLVAESRRGTDAARFVAQGHFGLAGMRERAAMIGGRLDVQTAVDYGTVVVLEAPMSIRFPSSGSAE